MPLDLAMLSDDEMVHQFPWNQERVIFTFLVNFTFAIIARPSVCRLSVTFVHTTQPVEIFGNFSMTFGTMAIHWHPGKMLRKSSQGNPSVGGLNARGVAKYSNILDIECHIFETVQDRTEVSIND